MKRQGISRNITGIVILAAGAMLLLNSLEMLKIDTFVQDYWPLGIILAGILILINSWRSWAIAGFLIILGGMYQLRVADVISFEPSAIVWPLILIFVGVTIIFGHAYAGKRFSKSERDDVTAILSGANINNHSKSFKQSNATTIMGGASIDLRKAEFNKNALIDIFNLWGGVEIIVPENVVIRNQINHIMAGTEDKTHQKTDKNSPVLTITGMSIMAGVSIRNTPSDY